MGEKLEKPLVKNLMLLAIYYKRSVCRFPQFIMILHDFIKETPYGHEDRSEPSPFFVPQAQCFGSALVSMLIRIQPFSPMRIWIRCTRQDNTKIFA